MHISNWYTGSVDSGTSYLTSYSEQSHYEQLNILNTFLEKGVFCGNIEATPILYSVNVIIFVV